LSLSSELPPSPLPAFMWLFFLSFPPSPFLPLSLSPFLNLSFSHFLLLSPPSLSPFLDSDSSQCFFQVPLQAVQQGLEHWCVHALPPKSARLFHWGDAQKQVPKP